VTFPAVLGRDVSGEVVAVGPGVTAFKVGTRVVGFVDHGYAAFVVAPVDAWAEIPAGLDLIDAAALPLVSLTGAQLVDAAGVREGDAVLVTGATGAVGRVAVFVAKSRGAKVFAGVRRNHKAEADKLGAEAVVALDDDQEIAKLAPLDALADTVGGTTTQKLLGKLKAGGRIGSVLGEPPGANERGFVVQAFSAHRDPKRLAELVAAAAAGKLIVPVAKRFPFSQAGAAHTFAEKGGVGKVLLLPDR
jgi:NADPH:quinone reductase-like Zn-dependent oxidoreductase